MPIQFPPSPSLNQEYTYEGKVWSWDGSSWVGVRQVTGVQKSNIWAKQNLLIPKRGFGLNSGYNGTTDQRRTKAGTIPSQKNYMERDLGLFAGDIISSGLVLNLDAGNILSYPGSGTTWTDLSGNSNNGTIVNGPTYVSAGASSYFSFGSGAQQRTSFTYQTPVQTAYTAFTWDIWAYPIANQDGYILMGYRGTTPLQFYKLTTQKFEMYPASIFSLFTLNVWQNITAVYDGTQSGTDNMKLYVNGTQVGSRSGSQPDLRTSDMPFYVGGDPIGGEYATARINQVAVYNRALSAAEVTTNFNTFKGRFGL